MQNLIDEQLAPVAPVEGGNTKRVSPSIYWCFTLNNWTPEEFTDLITFCKKYSYGSESYVIGEELGELKTPHLQGFIRFETKQRPLEVNKNKRIHWEKCKGSPEDNVKYCIKEGKYTCGRNYSNIYRPIKLVPEASFHKWQKFLLEKLMQPPDDRKLIWWYDEVGGKGKTSFAKYLTAKYDAVPVEGKKADVLYCCAQFESDMYIFDFERSMEDHVPYGAMEKVKNGYFMCGKYESKPIIRNTPHCVVFANFMPDWTKMSSDRWEVYDIIDNDTFIQREEERYV